MFQPNRPNRFDPHELPRNYHPRVIVKFRDNVTPPSLDDRPLVASAVTPTPSSGATPSWESLTRNNPGTSVSRMYPSAGPERLRDLMRRASAANEGRVPNLTNFFAVSLPREGDPSSVIAHVRRWSGVESAYLEPPPVPPPTVHAADDPRASSQGYLAAAPAGIDARHAWTVAGGDGASMNFIDIEQGWTLNHEDLVGRHITLISGVNNSYFGHGTSVLGEVAAEDNRLGIVGIAPAARVRVVSEWRTASTYDTSDAIIDAIVHLSPGDVILIEAQTTIALPTGGFSTFLPVEAVLHTWAAIWVATLCGITVIEAGGNGSNDLDAFSHPTDGFILKPGHAQFRESGAIMVGAASDSAPHRRLSFSNFGSRINCYAWGQNIMTTGDGWTGNLTNTYSNFSGTSGASPIIAGAALAFQGMVKAASGSAWRPRRVRTALSSVRNGTASGAPASDRIGVMPDLLKLERNEVAPLRPSSSPGGGTRPRLTPGAGDFPSPRGDTRMAGVAAYIDPGHGGAQALGRSSAYGGRGDAGPHEKDINLNIARAVRSHLGGVAALTRDGDYNLALRDRVQMARHSGAPVFVSVHANSGRTDRSGSEVWIYGDGGSPGAPASRHLAAQIQEQLQQLDGRSVPLHVAPMAVLDPRLHGYGVGACLVEADSLLTADGAARLSDGAAVDDIGGAIARGVHRYLGAAGGAPPADRRSSRRYGDAGGDEDPRDQLPAQACFHEDTAPTDDDDAAGALAGGFGVQALTTPTPPELGPLLTYLGASWATFEPRETAYFAGLTQHLRREGFLAASATVDRATYRDVIRRVQTARHLTADGIPNAETLWALQKTWAAGRRLGVTRVTADKIAGSDGYDRFRVRADIVDRYNAFRTEVVGAGGVVTSAGSFRELTATVAHGRSATSMHYSGLALDLATDTGMQNPARDPYIITQDGARWRIWCKAAGAPSRTLDAVVYRNGATTTRAVTANCFDLTAIAARHGFSPIGPRSTFPADYMAAEWWHLQCEEALQPYLSQFGAELLSLAMYNEAGLTRQTDIWANRLRIFKKDWW